jgi:hypothetical protein
MYQYSAPLRLAFSQQDYRFENFPVRKETPKVGRQFTAMLHLPETATKKNVHFIHLCRTLISKELFFTVTRNTLL